LDKRAAAVLGVIFGGLFLVLFAFLLLTWSAVKSAPSLGSLSDESTSAGARVGIVEVKGAIGDNERGANGEVIVRQIRKLERDNDVKAILVRVDSPGGAVAPSQEIYAALIKARERKKVVVSMGNLAASGGYYVASAAHVIYANKGTLTGSIGVIFTHFNVKGILDWAKVEETTIKSGKYKDTMSPFRPISDQDRSEMQGLSTAIYNQFIDDVASGRKKDREKIGELAEGRIYTGARAKEIGLVDELGSFDDALARAWKEAGQTGEPRVQWPRERELHLRDLLRGAFQGLFQGAAQGAAEGVRDAARGALARLPQGPLFLAPIGLE
jgi:protease IV